MVNKKVLDALNTQIQREFASEYAYIAMEAYFGERDLDGFANFFNVQAKEEREHAYKIFNYIVELGGSVELKALDRAPSSSFDSALEVFETALTHEEFTTKSIYEVLEVALEERDYATVSFLKWFIDEQVEEEDTMNTIITKLKLIGDDGTGLLILDKELGERSN